MNVLIQFEGCVVSATFRTYSFRVIDAPDESRQFTVKVSLKSFCPTLLKFQDGPPITFERLRQELDGEAQGSHADSHLNIFEPDIQQYLERHNPRKFRKKRPAMNLAPNRFIS
ncbi:MAG: hypothetical protein A3H27_09230 [Acidobacteria bacterium RIFCSPLOWO2_02_FULL_59_13]|nr:MAG: hypothetical protein A3H27_09230 [Acidobacteria bacterium RIFCSPLOWO2_02_FULL_59_13]